jgi:hypothetical protein
VQVDEGLQHRGRRRQQQGRDPLVGGGELPQVQDGGGQQQARPSPAEAPAGLPEAWLPGRARRKEVVI